MAWGYYGMNEREFWTLSACIDSARELGLVVEFWRPYKLYRAAGEAIAEACTYAYREMLTFRRR